MQATKRYGVLVLGITSLVILLIYKRTYNDTNLDDAGPSDNILPHRAKKRLVSEEVLHSLPKFAEEDSDFEPIDEEVVSPPGERRATRQRIYKNRKCRMETCFDLSACKRNQFKIYVYPTTDANEKMSANYEGILKSLRSSRYYTSDPTQACLFVLSYDTLDRDPLSPDYIHNLGTKVLRLKHWNNGRNHVIFNLYSGTYPDYLEDVGFNYGEAILAKASFSDNYYRSGFDISLPLFAKTHPVIAGDSGYVKANYFPPRRKYLLTFKGKRYTYGIGSGTRNALYHIHNGADIIMLTTCKHGKHWQKFSDPKCTSDNEEYDKWDYEALLHNSTFCMIPRGRRLGSFRFLESLQAGCVPVVLANGWMLPFAEVIDWSKAALVWEERLLLQVPGVVRGTEDDRVMAMRQQSQFLWNKYFSSIERVISTTFQIVHDRIYPEASRIALAWNNQPGGGFYMPQYSTSQADYPAYYDLMGVKVPDKFTAIIQATSPVLSSAAPIVKLVKTLLQTVSCHQIMIVWHCGRPPPPFTRWSSLVGERDVTILVIDDQPKLMSRRFFPFTEIEYNAVLSLDDDATVSVQEIDFAFDVWRTFPDRIVGFPSRNHYWDASESSWRYTSKWSNEYSIVLTGAAFIHRYYLSLFTSWLPAELRSQVDELSNCEDILMNMLVSHITRLPPIKVTQKKQYKDNAGSETTTRDKGTTGAGVVSQWSNPQHFAERQTCMSKFVEWFGYMPLLWSETRLDPALFKDNVAITRKRYPRIEI